MTIQEISVREARDRLSELLRLVQSGQRFEITSRDRPVAELGPVQRPQWRSWAEVASALSGPPVPDMLEDIAVLEDGDLVDPWEQ